MNNEFKKITIIGLSEVDVSKKNKMKTGAFMCLYAPVRLWFYGHHTNTNSSYKYRCICVIMRTGAFVDAMCTARIPIPIINLGSFLWYRAPVPHKDTRIGTLIRPMGTTQIPRPIRTASCVVSPTPSPVLLFSLMAQCILLQPPRCAIYRYTLVR